MAQPGWEGGENRQKAVWWSHSVLPEPASHAYTGTPVTTLSPTFELGSYLIEEVNMVGEPPCYLTVCYSLSVKQKYKWKAKTTDGWKRLRAYQSKQRGQQERVLRKLGSWRKGSHEENLWSRQEGVRDIEAREQHETTKVKELASGDRWTGPWRHVGLRRPSDMVPLVENDKDLELKEHRKHHA